MRRRYGNPLSRFMSVDMLDAYSYGRELGKAGEAVINSLSEGLNKSYGRIRSASEFFENLLKKEGATRAEIKKWGDTAHTFKLGSGESVIMTESNIMNLYVLSRREQAVWARLLYRIRTPRARSQTFRIHIRKLKLRISLRLWHRRPTRAPM